jgi:palmitoyltransferase
MEPSNSSPLCCCEYYNVNGQRTHLITLFCDCEDLDNAADQCLKGQGISGEKCGIICKVISDRIRIPWLRGAVKFNMESIVPLIVLSISLYFASSGFVFTVLSFVYLPIFVLVYYVYALRKKIKTWFFVSWACTSIVGIYTLFMMYIADKCSPMNNIALSLAFVLVLVLYYRVVTSKEKIQLFTQSKPLKNGLVPEMKKNPKSSETTEIDYEQYSCCFCTYGPFARGKHCRYEIL